MVVNESEAHLCSTGEDLVLRPRKHRFTNPLELEPVEHYPNRNFISHLVQYLSM